MVILLFCLWLSAQHTPGRISNRLSAFPGAAADCTALYHTGVQASGVYTIKPNGSEAFNVYCEMKFGKSCANNSLIFTEISSSKANNFVSSQSTQKLMIYVASS